MNQDNKYMIVLKPERLLAQYEQREISEEKRVYLNELRNAFKRFQPVKYCGISRDPLTPHVSLDPKIVNLFISEGSESPGDFAARRYYREILGEPVIDTTLDEDEDPPLSLNQARKILSLTDDPNTWEIIHVTRNTYNQSSATLGYDVGYWTVDWFSLIADVLVIPRWHPPARKDLAEVDMALSSLNNHLLFDCPGDAEDYRSFYQSRSWAETVGDFHIIQIESVE
jgi:hypothetical protein